MEHTTETRQKEPEITSDENPKPQKTYTHLLYIPIHSSQKFLKRCESLAGQIINDFPGFEPYLSF